MKRYKFLCIVAATIPAIMAMTGCAAPAAASLVLETQSVQQANDISEGKDESLPEEAADQQAEIVLNEWGYTYRTSGNGGGSIQETGDNVSDSQSGDEGTAEESPETTLQWDDAQNSLEENKLCWLDNEYLKSYAENISFVTSDSDIVTAKYAMQDSAVEVYVFTVAKDDDEHFEFVSNYPSEIYNIHQIGEEKTWQCFSYKGYDGTEYTSAVFAKDNIVCEIKFENCDEQFICSTLAVY